MEHLWSNTFICISCTLYEAFWNFIGSVMRHDCPDSVGKICKLKMNVEVTEHLLEAYTHWIFRSINTMGDTFKYLII